MLTAQNIYELCFNFLNERRLIAEDQTTFYRRMLVTDNVYSHVDMDDLAAVIRTNPLLQYVDRLHEEINDCDDYALQLKAAMAALYRHRAYSAGQTVYPPAVAIIITEYHALNLIVVNHEGEYQVYIVDTMMSQPAITQDPTEAWLLMKQGSVTNVYI
tara:strand:+ start:162 stop:635 length:474 start_codon:yes stop_codon:yes gene_type:complete